jgi:putative ATP-dependent endonuclease of OLD family
MSRLLNESNPSFRLEDFSCAAHHYFWDAYLLKTNGAGADIVRPLLPCIEVSLGLGYEKGELLGPLSDFVLDLDPDCTEALIRITYAIDAGKIDELFADLTATDNTTKSDFFKTLRDRIPELYATIILAVDPNDPSNTRPMSLSALRAVCANNYISAQRGLDDISQGDRVVIGKVLENLFTVAKSNEDDIGSHTIADELEVAVNDIQTKIGADFNAKLDALLPSLSLFGYPGLTDPKLLTETTLDVERLLTNHTKVRYTGSNGIHLPEAYNGLGARNIILILLQLRQYFKKFLALDPKPVVHLIFIEEPEVHLHPQMQEVFIGKLAEIAAAFSKEQSSAWPVQFVVSTHSSHIANKAHFDTIRYFMAVIDAASGELKTVVKDLRLGLAGKPAPDREFLHQYMTLTRCDLFFADKAILIEGTTERLILPKIIEMMDVAQPDGEKLGSQYISTLEVGGAYAHIFFDLLEFLELKTLIVTDIDTVAPRVKNGKTRMAACPVHLGSKSSNGCINQWFVATPNPTPSQLLAATDAEKVRNGIHIAQHPAANVSNLLTLATNASPFQSFLSSANDFSLGINYTGGNLHTPYGVAIDSSGNIWVPNTGSSSVTEISNSGAFLSGTRGYTNGGLNLPEGVAIDSSGDAWVPNFLLNTVTEISSSGVFLSGDNGYISGSLNNPRGIAIDSCGNAWVADEDNRVPLSRRTSSTLNRLLFRK